MKIKNILPTFALLGMVLTTVSVQSATARELLPDVEIAEDMTFVIDTKAYESPRNRKPRFIINPDSTNEYKFVKRLASKTYEGEDLGISSEGRRLGKQLYWLAEVVELSTGKTKVVAVPLEFRR